MHVGFLLSRPASRPECALAPTEVREEGDMGVAPIAAIGPAIIPAMPVFAAAITTAPATGQAAAAQSAAAPNQVDGAYYLVSGPAIAPGTSASGLEQVLMKAALLIGLLDNDDEKKKTNP